jgi:hypothetical protein
MINLWLVIYRRTTCRIRIVEVRDDLLRKQKPDLIDPSTTIEACVLEKLPSCTIFWYVFREPDRCSSLDTCSESPFVRLFVQKLRDAVLDMRKKLAIDKTFKR